MITYIIGGHGSGKTYAAVHWLLEKPDERVILTTSKLRAREICQQYGLTTDQVISAQGKLKVPHILTSVRHAEKELAIDDLDEFLRRAFTLPVAVATSNGEISDSS